MTHHKIKKKTYTADKYATSVSEMSQENSVILKMDAARSSETLIYINSITRCQRKKTYLIQPAAQASKPALPAANCHQCKFHFFLIQHMGNTHFAILTDLLHGTESFLRS